MHPTQHSTHKRPLPPIIRTYHRITGTPMPETEITPTPEPKLAPIKAPAADSMSPLHQLLSQAAITLQQMGMAARRNPASKEAA